MYSSFHEKNLIIHELFCHIYFEKIVVAESQATQLFNESQERATMISENFCCKSIPQGKPIKMSMEAFLWLLLLSITTIFQSI